MSRENGWCEAVFVDLGGDEVLCLAEFEHEGKHRGVAVSPCPQCGGRDDHLVDDCVSDDGEDITIRWEKDHHDEREDGPPGVEDA